jgi:hypothetical protein
MADNAQCIAKLTLLTPADIRAGVTLVPLIAMMASSTIFLRWKPMKT